MDPATIQAARRGSRAARGRLLVELQDRWYRVCLSLLDDGALAREATQETAMRFLRGLPTFRGESRLSTWAIGIAMNVAREMRRQQCAPGTVKATVHQALRSLRGKLVGAGHAPPLP